MKSHYDLLGVRRHASLQEIGQSYRRCLNRHLALSAARKLSKKDQLRLQRARTAFLVLSSPTRRQQYDRLLLQRERKRDRMLDIGGAILAVSALVAGLVLIAGSTFFEANESWNKAPPHTGSSTPPSAPDGHVRNAG